MITPSPFGIIFAAPTTWSTKIMSENLETCVDPYLDLFERDLRRRELHGEDDRNYRCLTRRFGALMDAAGIAPSALTLECANDWRGTCPKADRTGYASHDSRGGSPSI